jgi:hypothetical protein
MKITLDIPEYDSNKGFSYKWENGFEIKIGREDNTIVLSANKAGLLSLANHCINLAQDDVPFNYHLHFDQSNSLEDGSLELLIQKVK